MLPRINPTNTKAWSLLSDHAKKAKALQLSQLFKADENRFEKFSDQSGDIYFDYSKNIITEETMQYLFQLAEECKLKQGIEEMFAGEKINETENRSVLHVALRNLPGEPVYSEGIDVMPGVKQVLGQMKSFCQKIHSGEWTGYTGKKIKYII